MECRHFPESLNLDPSIETWVLEEIALGAELSQRSVRSGRFVSRAGFGVALDFPLYYRRSFENCHAARTNRRLDACSWIPPYALALLAHCESPKRR
jgi:hypothetical protein